MYATPPVRLKLASCLRQRLPSVLYSICPTESMNTRNVRDLRMLRCVASTHAAVRSNRIVRVAVGESQPHLRYH
jgi:hypothetical protein